MASCTAGEGRLNFATAAGSDYRLAYRPRVGIAAIPYAPHPSALYDLTGRRLATPPTQGIYIRDGRKVLVK